MFKKDHLKTALASLVPIDEVFVLLFVLPRTERPQPLGPPLSRGSFPPSRHQRLLVVVRRSQVGLCDYPAGAFSGIYVLRIGLRPQFAFLLIISLVLAISLILAIFQEGFEFPLPALSLVVTCRVLPREGATVDGLVLASSVLRAAVPAKRTGEDDSVDLLIFELG